MTTFHWLKLTPAAILKISIAIAFMVTPLVQYALPTGGSGSSLASDNFYYTFDNQKIIIYKVPDKYMVEYTNGLYTNTNSSGGQTYPGVWQPHNRFLVTDTSNLDSYGPSHFVTSAYKTPTGKAFYYAKEIVLRFNANVSAAEKSVIIAANNLTFLRSSLTFEIYKVQGDAIEIAKAVYMTGKVRFCHPDFLAQVDKFEHIPNDTYFAQQWYLRNTGQNVNGKTGVSGADINVTPAWDITKGNANIVIAVIDQGVTANHPDLPNSRQVRLPGSNFAYLFDGSNNPDDPTPDISTTVSFNHGNAVSGIIAATQDNNQGVSGIAPLCKIMPIKNILGIDYPSESICADAINFAVINNVDIISCSWGVADPNPNYWPAVVDAIENALNHGIIVLFAIGNNAEREFNGLDNGISFPANNERLLNLGMVSVGASERKNKQANYSPNGENISVVAPSHSYYWDAPAGAPQLFVGEGFNIWTIDIPHNEGGNPWKHIIGSTEDHVPPGLPNDYGTINPSNGTNNLAYTAFFGGTSAATPEVAGVAALMLSVNACLGNNQIKELLQGTADKVGDYDYNQNPARVGQSVELGYGKINAYKAVKAAQAAQSSTLDLYMKDNPNDIGTVGINGTGGGGDQSPDIWLRNQNDGKEHQEHQAPEYQDNSPVYVYVKVRNKSCVASSGTEQLHLYWHAATAGGTGWPGGWDGSGPNGGPVGIETIPVLKQGETAILTFEWPMSQNFSAQTVNACLLARIEGVAADPITEYTDMQTHLLVNENNNVAIKNITIVNIEPGFAPAAHGFVWLINESALDRAYKLFIKVPGWGDGFAHDITKEAEVSLTFDPIGWNMLQASGSMEQEGIRKGGEREIFLTNPDITLNNLYFDAGVAMPMQVKFNFLTDEYTENKTYQLAFSSEDLDKPDEILGTETFIINKYGREPFNASAGNNKSVYPNENVQLSALDIDEPALYNWYDTSGTLIYTGKDLTVTAGISKKYRLEVISLSDGFKDYDEVLVEVKRYYLTNIAPNPAGAQTTISYNTRGANSAYLILVQPFGNTTYNYILDANENKYALNTSTLPAGVYSVILVCDGEISDSKSLQIN